MKSTLNVTLEDAFDLGHKEGAKLQLTEIQEMINQGANLETLKVYTKAKLNTLNLQLNTNPFKQKESNEVQRIKPIGSESN